MLIWKQTIATKKTSLGWRLRATLVPFALSYTLCTDQNNVFSFFFLISHLLVCVCIYIYAFTRETTTEQTRSDSSVGFLVCQVVWRCLIWQRLILMLITPQWQHVLGAQGTSRHKTTTTRGLRWEQIDDKDSTKGDVLFSFSWSWQRPLEVNTPVFIVVFINFLTIIIWCVSQSEGSLGKWQ